MAITFTKEQKAEIRRLSHVGYQPLPTLFLFLAGCVFFLYALYLGWLGRLALSFCLACIGQYFLFTTMHEAVHRNASHIRVLNWFIGMCSAFAFFSTFTGFRYVHLKHHRYTNHPTKDPDLWSGKSALVLRWLTQDLYYYVVYLGDKGYLMPPFWRAVLQTFCNFLILFYMAKLRGWSWPLCSWLIPARITVAWLSMVFNYLPHIPHVYYAREPWKNTLNRRPRVLGWILLGQNLHQIHHLLPSAPFYRYQKIWEIMEPELVRNGTVVREKIFEL
jgi:beta-carotene hydroxylase